MFHLFNKLITIISIECKPENICYNIQAVLVINGRIQNRNLKSIQRFLPKLLREQQ